MDDLGYEGRGRRILELERELAEARQGIRVACWWCGRSPQDEPAIQLRRLNPKGIRGVFQCQHCVTDDDKARRGILECQTRILALNRELAEAKDRIHFLGELVGGNRIEVLLKDRDKAHSQLAESYAAIRAYKKDHDEESQYVAAGEICECVICKAHAAAIRRASQLLPPKGAGDE